jgi:tellurite resistance protein TerC
MKIQEHRSIKTAKRIIVAIFGFTVLIIGIAMILLPGPALIVIPLGLAILATEFLWARRLLKKLKNALHVEKEEKNGR